MVGHGDQRHAAHELPSRAERTSQKCSEDLRSRLGHDLDPMREALVQDVGKDDTSLGRVRIGATRQSAGVQSAKHQALDRHVLDDAIVPSARTTVPGKRHPWLPRQESSFA